MEKEINLKNLFAVIQRRLWIIVVVTLTIMVMGATYSIFLKTPLYTSSARILIPANNDTMSSTLTVMINEPVVMEKVAAELNIKRSASALSGQITAESVQGSQIVKINVTDKDPVLATKIANVTAAVYKEEAARILNFNNVSILSEAALKYSVPINVNHVKTIMTAFIVGLVLSIGFVFLLDSLDDTIKSERAIEKLLDVPTLGSISKMNKRSIADKYSEKKSILLRRIGKWFSKTEEKETESRKKA
ncbi:YveK family protein [Bacillus rhizoplanae]|uniref:YveK family protein n=1 Tax=Bacillus rhizoplanae TaxID=2880966 RepID=UPI003D2138A9